MLGLKGIKKITEFELKDQVVFLRLDLNVPLEIDQKNPNGLKKISDATRIRESLPTIRYAIEQGAKVVIASHLGRPKEENDPNFSLEPVALYLTEHLKKEVILLEEVRSEVIKQVLLTLGRNQIILLENLRYDEGETENSPELAKYLSSFSQIYINDAFGASHRAHASIHALPEMMPKKGIGFLIEKEINFLDKLIVNPGRPYLAVMGGSKVSDKIEVIEKLIDIVDGFIIGGAMAYTFLKAMGKTTGSSLVEADKVKYAAELIERISARSKTLLLPIDHRVSTGIKDTHFEVTIDANIREKMMGVDIGPKTEKLYSDAIKMAQTVFWNGPMGVFETKEFSQGTFAIAKAIGQSPGIKVVGGGDSASAAHASGFADLMSHISTGGGASLEYLQGDRLPGLEVLRSRQQS
ncbi:MAG: phosphoglycerate kinase [Pseudobdellovibrionaceae bacterium]